MHGQQNIKKNGYFLFSVVTALRSSDSPR